MHFLGKIRGSQTACLMAYGLHSQLTKGSSGSIMGTRMIHKRDKKHAAHVSKIALRMMAVLVMSGDYIPACLMGMIHRAEHRRSLQREMHWRKTYASHGFNWDSEAWNDGQCQDLLHWPRGGAEKLGRLFFLPAMQSAPGTNGVKLLQQDSDGQRCGWLAGCCLRRLRICARPAHHARTQTEHAPHRSYARAAGRVEWPAHISRVGFRHSQGRMAIHLCAAQAQSLPFSRGSDFPTCGTSLQLQGLPQRRKPDCGLFPRYDAIARVVPGFDSVNVQHLAHKGPGPL